MGWISAVGVSRTGLCATLAAVLVGALTDSDFRAPAQPPVEGVRVGAGGTIVGTITTKEPVRPAIRATIDPAVCGQSVPDESIVVGASGQLANVVVSVPGVKAAQPADVSFANDKCRFVPRVGLMKAGGAVKMVSRDAGTLHTMHAAGADGRAFFNVSIPVPNVALSRPVARAGLVTLSCSTHTWMRGYIHVTDGAAAISGPDGRYRIDAVPAGKYQLNVWHETLKVSSPVTVVVKDGETATVDVVLIK